MRKILVLTFVTLDGVMQSPGGPEEDASGGFKYGGWSMPHFDDFLGGEMDAQMGKPFDLLLGRKTFEIFASYWPLHADEGPASTGPPSTSSRTRSRRTNGRRPSSWEATSRRRSASSKPATAPTCRSTAAPRSSRPCWRTTWWTSCGSRSSRSRSGAVSACSARAWSRPASSCWRARLRRQA